MHLLSKDESGICGGRGDGLNDGGQMHGGQAWSSPQRKEGGVGAPGEEGDYTPGGRIVRRQSDRTISRLETERADLIAQIRNEREKTRAVKTRLQESRKHMQVSDECTRFVFTSLLVVLRTRRLFVSYHCSYKLTARTAVVQLNVSPHRA